MADRVVFKYGPRSTYEALATKDASTLYFLTDTGEIYKGTTNLSQPHHYEVIRAEGQDDNAAIAAAVGSNKIVKGDICIIKTLIANDKYSYTAYVCEKSVPGQTPVWKAMDGNYNAENIYFDDNLTFTYDVGSVKVDSTGSAVVESKGKNVKELIEMLFSKEDKEPEATAPTATWTTSGFKSYEVGSTATPGYDITFNQGSYPYGPDDTGVVPTYSVSDGTTTLTNKKGDFNSFTVTDNTSYKITATINYNKGVTPNTNLGNAATGYEIPAGTITLNSSTITGYRSFFYGCVADANATIDSAMIRGLKNGGNYNGSKTVSLAASEVEGTTRVLVAVPASSTRAGLTKVLLTSAQSSEIQSEFKPVANVVVEGANGAAGVEYKVWQYKPANLDSTETYSITLG